MTGYPKSKDIDIAQASRDNQTDSSNIKEIVNAAEEPAGYRDRNIESRQHRYLAVEKIAQRQHQYADDDKIGSDYEVLLLHDLALLMVCGCRLARRSPGPGGGVLTLGWFRCPDLVQRRIEGRHRDHAEHCPEEAEYDRQGTET